MTALVEFRQTYENHQLTLVCEPGKSLNWADYPVTITQSQFATIENLTALIAVLEDSFKMPSEAAGISANKVASPTIHVIDRKYRKAKLDYKQFLAEAEGKDLTTLQSLHNTYKIRSFVGFYGFFYTVGEYFGFKYKRDIEVAKEGSNHRLAFMQKVSTLEMARLNDIKDRINRCLTPLLADITDHQVEDIAVLKQLHQITAIYRALFPNEVHQEVEAATKLLEEISRESAGLITM